MHHNKENVNELFNNKAAELKESRYFTNVEESVPKHCSLILSWLLYMELKHFLS